MNKFKLPEPPIFNINPPPMPPMESSKSFLFSNFDYLFEITNNKCLGLVNKNYKNIDINDTFDKLINFNLNISEIDNDNVVINEVKVRPLYNLV